MAEEKAPEPTVAIPIDPQPHNGVRALQYTAMYAGDGIHHGLSYDEWWLPAQQIAITKGAPILVKSAAEPYLVCYHQFGTAPYLVEDATWVSVPESLLPLVALYQQQSDALKDTTKSLSPLINDLYRAKVRAKYGEEAEGFIALWGDD